MIQTQVKFLTSLIWSDLQHLIRFLLIIIGGEVCKSYEAPHPSSWESTTPAIRKLLQVNDKLIWTPIKHFILFASWWCPRDKSMKKTLQHLILCGGSKCRMWLFLCSVCAAIVYIFIVSIDFRCYAKYHCSDCRLISKLIRFLTLTIWYGRSYEEPLLFQLHSQFLILKKTAFLISSALFPDTLELWY